MNLKTIGIVAGLSVLAIVFFAAAFADAATINRFFGNVLLIIAGFTSLIEPSKGLIESLGVLALTVTAVLTAISLRQQQAVKAEQQAAKQERAAIAVTLSDQNDKMAVIHDAVESVKATVAPEPPKDYAT